MIYTSGCPKNQNTCWNRTGSPPPAALKKLVPKLMSISIMVTTPASTGMTAISKNTVINQVHTNMDIFMSVMPGARILSTVEITLIAAMTDDTLMISVEKIKKAEMRRPEVL